MLAPDGSAGSSGDRDAAPMVDGPGPAPVARAAPTDFRPDLEGLRGVAVLLVLAYHAGLPVAGGFIGVDVFFVLSGFLITGLLVRERERRGRIGVTAFYARRVRRILPAAAVVVAATICVAPLVISPLDMSRVAGDGVSSILSFANMRFAAADLDYFGASATPSPFRQFWSLAVEEQFYLLWPALLIVGMSLLLPRARSPRVGAAVVVGGALVASVAACFVVTGIAVPWAFYSLPTRAWQLAAGGLLAIALPLVPRIPRSVALATGWLGAALLLACAVTFGDVPDYPGWHALLPTVATLAIIASGELAFSPGRTMQVAPLRFAGRISYSLYLWHWPILVLTAAALGAPLPLPVGLLLAGGAILVATASHTFVEQPFRYGSAGGSMSETLLRAAGAIAAVGILAVGIGAVVTAVSGLGPSSQAAGTSPAGVLSPADVAALDDPVLLTDPGAVVTDGLDTSGAAGSAADGSSAVDPAGPSPDTGDATGPASPAAGLPAAGSPAAGSPAAGPPVGAASTGIPASAGWGAAGRLEWGIDPASPGPTATPVPLPRPTFVASIAAPPTGVAVTGALPADVQPGIAAAREDKDPLLESGCAVDHLERAPKVCVFGRKDAPHTVVLIGDSHAAQWFGALRVLAKERDWRLVPFTKNACTFIDAPIVYPFTKTRYVECAAWIEAVMRIVPTLHPDLVVVTMNRWIIPAAGAPTGMVEQGRAIGRLLARLPHPVALLSDTPFFGVDVPACLAGNRSNVSACRARPGATYGYDIPRDKAAAASGKATLVDMTRAICPRLPCAPVVDGIIVMRDEHHLTYTFSRHLARPLGAVLDRMGVGLLSDADGPTPPTVTPAPSPGDRPASTRRGGHRPGRPTAGSGPRTPGRTS
jgi:peptidoglycan/LPS O-acetylase OafA/YrhL